MQELEAALAQAREDLAQAKHHGEILEERLRTGVVEQRILAEEQEKAIALQEALRAERAGHRAAASGFAHA